MENRFRLFDLPAGALQHVLQVMEVRDVFVISFLSKRCESLITKNWRATPLSSFLSIGFNSVTLFVDFGIDMAAINLRPPTNQRILANPTFIEFTATRPKQIQPMMNVGGVTAKDSINRILRILSVRKLFKVTIGDDHQPPGIQDFLRGVSFHRLVLVNHIESAFTRSLPPADQYQIGTKFPRTFMENSKFLALNRSAADLAFDDLLLMNSEYIDVGFTRLTDASINRYIKSWRRGAHRRLKYLEIKCRSFQGWTPRAINVEEVMRGVEYEVVTQDRQFLIPYTRNGRPQTYAYLGGLDVVVFDGRAKASIFVMEDHMFQMFVTQLY